MRRVLRSQGVLVEVTGASVLSVCAPSHYVEVTVKVEGFRTCKCNAGVERVDARVQKFRMAQ